MLLRLHHISGLVSQQLCKTIVIYAYKNHKNKTLCFIKLSHVNCASDKHNFTLLHTLQTEQICSLR